MEHLTLADEIVVLMLDDETGAIRPLCAGFANAAIAGGILMELALLARIDTDLKSLYVIDPKPVGDEILDSALQEIAAEPRHDGSKSWIRHFAFHKSDLTNNVLGRLLAVIFDDAIPSPRDTLLLSLADSSGVLDAILSADELRKASKRIEQVVAFEEIGRSVKAVEAEIQLQIEIASIARPM